MTIVTYIIHNRVKTLQDSLTSNYTVVQNCQQDEHKVGKGQDAAEIKSVLIIYFYLFIYVTYKNRV